MTNKGNTSTYHRPWSIVDTEELSLLRQLEQCMRDLLPDGSPRMIWILEQLSRLPSR